MLRLQLQLIEKPRQLLLIASATALETTVSQGFIQSLAKLNSLASHEESNQRNMKNSSEMHH